VHRLAAWNEKQQLIAPEIRRQGMLIFKKQTKSQKWYQQHKQELSEKRKKLYADNPEYRKQRIEASRKYRRGERTPAVPTDAPISFSEAAKRVGIGASTLREWRRKKLFPEPKHRKGHLFFTENQVSLLREIKHVVRIYRMRWTMRQEELKKLDVFQRWDSAVTSIDSPCASACQQQQMP